MNINKFSFFALLLISNYCKPIFLENFTDKTINYRIYDSKSTFVVSGGIEGNESVEIKLKPGGYTISFDVISGTENDRIYKALNNKEDVTVPKVKYNMDASTEDGEVDLISHYARINISSKVDNDDWKNLTVNLKIKREVVYFDETDLDNPRNAECEIERLVVYSEVK